MVASHRRNEIRTWLSPPDHSISYTKALSDRHKGTGGWFLKSDSFRKWKTRQNSFLWLYGIPGCGKTILSSSIIESLASITSNSKPLLFFYFSSRDKTMQLLDSMVRSLIWQLYCKWENGIQELDSLFSNCERDGRRQPTMEELCSTFLHIVQQVDEISIVLDALDECATRSGPQTKGGLLSWIKELLKSQLKNFHILVTSRQEADIELALNECVRAKDMLSIQSDVITNDIRAYVQSTIRRDEELRRRWEALPDVQKEIEKTIVDKANGM